MLRRVQCDGRASMTCQRIDGSTDRREDVRETLGRRPLHEQPEG